MSKSIFYSNAQALVNPVNCVGIMGKGLALEFKRRYPNNFASYQRACAVGLEIGNLHTCEEDGKLIINFPTKKHWKAPSKYEYILEGLLTLAELIKQKQIKSIAIPRLGCGLGGLDWNIVRKMIIAISKHCPETEFEIF